MDYTADILQQSVWSMD